MEVETASSVTVSARVGLFATGPGGDDDAALNRRVGAAARVKDGYSQWHQLIHMVSPSLLLSVFIHLPI
jgi:hypothetical protein